MLWGLTSTQKATADRAAGIQTGLLPPWDHANHCCHAMAQRHGPVSLEPGARPGMQPFITMAPQHRKDVGTCVPVLRKPQL